MTHPGQPRRSDGRSALERLGAELAQRDAERETRERLRVARAEARRDRAAEAIVELRSIMDGLWRRISELVPMTMVYSPQRLELEQAMLEWDVEHEVVPEDSFARSGWDVYAGAWLRLHQRDSVFDYPGCSSSLWYAKLPGETHPCWHEVAYNAVEGNAPAEEPFALKDLIKSDLVASDSVSNLFQVFEPLALEADGLEAFQDRWMGLLAAAAIGDLDRPPLHADEHAAGDDRSAPHADAPPPNSNPIMDRLRDLGA